MSKTQFPHVFPGTSVYSSSRKHSRKWTRGAESYSDSETLCLAQGQSPVKMLWRMAQGFQGAPLVLSEQNTLDWRSRLHDMTIACDEDVLKCLQSPVRFCYPDILRTGRLAIMRGTEIRSASGSTRKSHPEAREFWSWVIFFYRTPGVKKSRGTCGH